jgi:cytochrome c553
LSGQVGPQIAGHFKQEALADFPKRREQRSAAARQTLDLLTKCAACYREAADKFEEASRQGVDNEVREYLSLQAKATRKLAEVKAGVMDMVKLLLDESVGDVQTLEARMGPLGQALDAMSHDADVLADQAKKVCADHPTRFATLQRG